MADMTEWMSIALVAIVAIIAFKWLATTPVGRAIPGYTQLAAFV